MRRRPLHAAVGKAAQRRDDDVAITGRDRWIEAASLQRGVIDEPCRRGGECAGDAADWRLLSDRSAAEA